MISSTDTTRENEEFKENAMMNKRLKIQSDAIAILRHHLSTCEMSDRCELKTKGQWSEYVKRIERYKPFDPGI